MWSNIFPTFIPTLWQRWSSFHYSNYNWTFNSLHICHKCGRVLKSKCESSIRRLSSLRVINIIEPNSRKVSYIIWIFNFISCHAHPSHLIIQHFECEWKCFSNYKIWEFDLCDSISNRAPTFHIVSWLCTYLFNFTFFPNIFIGHSISE